MATITESPSGLVLHPQPGDDDKFFDPERIFLMLSMSQEMNAVIEELMRRSGCSKADILNRGVGLYKAVSDAVRAGKQVCVLDADGEIETEFVGF